MWARRLVSLSLHPAGVLLLEHGKAHIWAHSQAVAEAVKPLAVRFGIAEGACVEAALCHDVGGMITPAQMLADAERYGFGVDPAEERYPFLLHQRYSRLICAEQLGIADEAILSAVGCHTTLKANASPLDMAVYLADKLAWDQPGAPPYQAVVEAALAHSLEKACLVHMDYIMAHGMLLMPHHWFLEAKAWLEVK